MSTANSPFSTPAEQPSVQGALAPQLLDQRLEAIDQALVGLLPRHERLTAVAQVETRIREIAGATPAGGGIPQPLPLTDPSISQPSSGTPSPWQQAKHFASATTGWMLATKKKRSRVAVTAGVLGIISLGLVFATPVSYLLLMLVAEIVGEIGAYILLGAHVLAISATGFAAVGLGCMALLILWRRKEQLAGYGWAITALCTGALPVLVGCTAVILLGLELGAAELFTTTVQAVASSEDSSTTGMAELKSEIAKLRQELSESGHVLPPIMDPNGRPVVRSAAGQLGHIYPTASESDDGNGPQALPPVCRPASNGDWTRSPSPAAASCAPACAAPSFAGHAPQCAAPAAAPEPSQPTIYAAPSAAASSPVVRPAEYAPAPSSSSPRAEPAPHAAPQSAPRPDAPPEPIEMPESAPVISR